MMRRDAIVAEARAWIGTPFRHRASLRGAGCDCLGLVRGVWRALIGPEPEMPIVYGRPGTETSRAGLLAAGLERHLTSIDRADAGPGDVLLFRWRHAAPPNHLGILAGPGLLIHAYEAARGVTECPLTRSWQRRVAAAYRFPGVTD